MVLTGPSNSGYSVILRFCVLWFVGHDLAVPVPAAFPADSPGASGATGGCAPTPGQGGGNLRPPSATFTWTERPAACNQLFPLITPASAQMREAPCRQGWGQGPSGCEAPRAGLTQGSLCPLLGQHNGTAGGHPTPPAPCSTPRTTACPAAGRARHRLLLSVYPTTNFSSSPSN